MELPSYWLNRPESVLEPETQQAFERLYAQTLQQPGPINYNLTAPKWQFLCYLADHHNLAFHGSGDPNIVTFEPRQPEDLTSFGNQKAVYAASDALWAMYFAIVDRDNHPMSLCNACISVSETPYYFFSISKAALAQQPWRTGTVYLLPPASFIKQPSMMLGETEIKIAQLASLTPVDAIARIEVRPADFPLLDQILGHPDERLGEWAEALGTGKPLPED